MAQVPEYGLQQVAPQGSVSPVSMNTPTYDALNHYAGQMGRAVDEFSGVVKQAAEKMDQARVAEAETELYKFMTDRKAGDNGYLKLKLQDALNPDDDGNSLPDREDFAMQRRIEELMGGLNARQREMFKQRAQSYRRQQYGASSQHLYQEAQAYMKASNANLLGEAMRSVATGYKEMDTIASSLARAQEAMLAMNPGVNEDMQISLNREAADKVLGSAIDSALAACDQDPDALRDAENVMSQMGHLMNPEASAKYSDKIRKVKDVFDLDAGSRRINEALRAPDMGPLTLAFGGVLATNGNVPLDKIPQASNYLFSRLFVMMESGGKQAVETVNAAGEKVFTVQIGRRSNGELPEDESEWSYGVSQIQKGNAKYAAEQLLHVKWDEKLFMGTSEAARQYNLSLGQAFFGEMLRKAKGDLLLAAAYYHSGETKVNKAVAKGKAEGKDWAQFLGPDGRKYVADFKERLYKLRDDTVKRPDGSVVDQFNVREVAAHRGSFSQLAVEKWIAANAPIDTTCARAAIDPVFRDNLIKKTMDRQKIEQDDYVNTQTNLLAQATDLIVQGKAVPASITSQLTFAQQQRLNKFEHEFQNNIDTGDLGYASYLYGVGSANFLAMNESEMKLAVRQCPKAQREQLTAAWYKHQQEVAMAANAAADNNAALNNGVIRAPFQVQTGMIRQQLNLLLSADPKRKKAFGEGGIERAIAVLQPTISQEMQMAGTKPDEAAVRNFIREYLNRSYAVDGFFGVVNGKSVFDLKADDLPDSGPDDARKIIEQLTRNRMGIGYQGEITPEMMMQTFQYLMLAPRPQIRFAGLKINREMWDDINNDAPNDASYVRRLRRYLAYRIAGVKPKSKINFDDSVYVQTNNPGEQ